MNSQSPAEGLPSDLKVALVHDWLTGMRGGEKCLEVMAEIFPQADLHTLLHVPGSVSPVLENRRVVTSFIQRLPAAEKTYRWALPLFPLAIERFDFSGYDLVLSSSHCVAKGAVTGPETLSVCYCYTPMRYVWDRFDDYFGDKRFPVRQVIAAQARRLRAWDRRTAGRVDHWLPISTLVKRRLREFYDEPESKMTIVFPPVDVERFETAHRLTAPNGLASRSYELVVSALVPYKKIDLAIRAARLGGRTLVVIGKGPELARLLSLAEKGDGRGRIIFAGAVSDAELPAYYAHCRSFVFPGLEDFGITPLEATAAGRPTVAFGEGGVADTVVEGLNGVLFAEQGAAALAAALEDPRLDGDWDHKAMLDHARRFSRQRYKQEMTTEIARAWAKHRSNAS